MVTTAVSLLPSSSFFCRQRSIATVAFQCSSTNPKTKNSDFNGGKATTTSTPPLLKFAVTGVTELLRLFNNRPPNLREEISEEKVVVECVDDVVTVLRFDYGNAYFLTGDVDCVILLFTIYHLLSVFVVSVIRSLPSPLMYCIIT